MIAAIRSGTDCVAFSCFFNISTVSLSEKVRSNCSPPGLETWIQRGDFSPWSLTLEASDFVVPDILSTVLTIYIYTHVFTWSPFLARVITMVCALSSPEIMPLDTDTKSNLRVAGSSGHQPSMRQTKRHMQVWNTLEKCDGIVWQCLSLAKLSNKDLTVLFRALGR